MCVKSDQEAMVLKSNAELVAAVKGITTDDARQQLIEAGGLRGFMSQSSMAAHRELLERWLADGVQREAFVTADKVCGFLKARLRDRFNECFAVMYLDNSHRLIEYCEMFEGTVSGAAVYPRVVAQKALELNAAAVILVHNHPSGVPEPSKADRDITERLNAALSVFDVSVLDHIVVGDIAVSMKARGFF